MNEPIERNVHYVPADEDEARLHRLGPVMHFTPLSEGMCHCGRPVQFGFDGDPTHHRGMCADCDAVRCDAYPLDCPYRDQSCDGRHECHAPEWPTGPGQEWRCPECGRLHESFAVTRETVAMPDSAWRLVPPNTWGWRSSGRGQR